MVARAVLVALFMTACTVGEVPIGGGPDGGGGNNNGTGGGQSFNAMVKPLVTECVACHSAGQPPNLMSFNMLQATYKQKPGSTNVLATKEDHQGVPYLTNAERMTVAAWIDSL